jgi:hypothetical protein
MEKSLVILWGIDAIINLAAFCVDWDTDKLIIALMAICLAALNWKECKNK